MVERRAAAFSRGVKSGCVQVMIQTTQIQTNTIDFELKVFLSDIISQLLKTETAYSNLAGIHLFDKKDVLKEVALRNMPVISNTLLRHVIVGSAQPVVNVPLINGWKNKRPCCPSPSISILPLRYQNNYGDSFANIESCLIS